MLTPANRNSYMARYMRLARAKVKVDLDNALLASEKRRSCSMRESYSDWLKTYNWDYFMTATFRSPRKEPYYAMESVNRVLEKHNVARTFLGCEPFQSGDLHIHGILAGPGPGWFPVIDMPWQIWESLFHAFGRSKVGTCRSTEAVSAYCSKYILKQQSRVCDYYSIYGTDLDWKNGILDKRQGVLID